MDGWGRKLGRGHEKSGLWSRGLGQNEGERSDGGGHTTVGSTHSFDSALDDRWPPRAPANDSHTAGNLSDKKQRD